MTNNNLHLSVINDGATYERRKHLAFAHIEGALSAEGYRRAVREICQEAARNERLQFGSKTTSTDLKNCTDEVSRYMLAHAWECIDRQDDTMVQAVIRRWRDEVNGNSYFTARVTVTCSDGRNRSFLIPFQYGYGSHPEWTVRDVCIDRGLIPDPGRYENGMRKGGLSDAPISFEDQGFMRKNQMFGR